MNSTKKVVAFTMAALATYVVVTLMLPANASTEEEIIPPVQEVHVSETVEEPAKEEVKAPTKPPMTEAYKTEVEAESAAEIEAEEVPVIAEIPAVISPMVEEIADDVVSNEEIYMEEPATEEVDSDVEMETAEPIEAEDVSVVEEEFSDEANLTGGMIWGIIDTDPVSFPAEEEVVWEEEIPDEPEEEVNELDASIANSVESLKGCVRIYSDGTEEQIYSDEYIADLAAITSVYGGDIVDYNNTVSYLNTEGSEDLMSAMTQALFGEDAGQEELDKAEEILGSYL